jgi:hypothetical protein
MNTNQPAKEDATELRQRKTMVERVIREVAPPGSHFDADDILDSLNGGCTPAFLNDVLREMESRGEIIQVGAGTPAEYRRKR